MQITFICGYEAQRIVVSLGYQLRDYGIMQRAITLDANDSIALIEIFKEKKLSIRCLSADRLVVL